GSGHGVQPPAPEACRYVSDDRIARSGHVSRSEILRGHCDPLISITLTLNPIPDPSKGGVRAKDPTAEGEPSPRGVGIGFEVFERALRAGTVRINADPDVVETALRELRTKHG